MRRTRSCARSTRTATRPEPGTAARPTPSGPAPGARSAPRGKADHVTGLCARAGLAPRRVLEVGCGDGAILGGLASRRFAPTLDGCELSQAAAAIAAGREGVGEVRVITGDALPYADASYDVGILSHVLEHVHDPVALLTETARVCRAVVVEVPLEDNASARRPQKRAHALEIGHLQRFSRAAMHQVVAGAGLRVERRALRPAAARGAPLLGRRRARPQTGRRPLARATGADDRAAARAPRDHRPLGGRVRAGLIGQASAEATSARAGSATEPSGATNGA